MKKIIWIIACLVLVCGCGKDGGLGPQGPAGLPGTIGPTGHPGPGTRTTYTGTIPAMETNITIAIPEITAADMPNVTVYYQDDVKNSGGVVVGQAWYPGYPIIVEGGIYHNDSTKCGKNYIVVITK